jgi:hypothetical protein
VDASCNPLLMLLHANAVKPMMQMGCDREQEQMVMLPIDYLFDACNAAAC